LPDDDVVAGTDAGDEGEGESRGVSTPVLLAFRAPPEDDDLLMSGKLRFVPTESKDEMEGRWCMGPCVAAAAEMGRWITEARREVAREDDGRCAGEPAVEDSSAMGEMDPSLSRAAGPELGGWSVPGLRESRFAVAVLLERLRWL